MNENDKNKAANEQNLEGEQDNGPLDPLEALKEMRQNYVPKTDYEKVVKEKNDYFKALVNGDTIEQKVEEKVDVNELRKDLFSEDSNLTNLDFAENALKLREEIINTEGKDIFCPYGKHISPQDSDYVDAQRVADGLQHCIDIADGNPDIFRNELYRITVDNIPKSVINSRIKR